MLSMAPVYCFPKLASRCGAIFIRRDKPMPEELTLHDVLADTVRLLGSPYVAAAVCFIVGFAFIPRIVRIMRYALSDDPDGNRERSLQWAHEQTKQAPPPAPPYNDRVEMGLEDPEYAAHDNLTFGDHRGIEDHGAGASMMYLQDETTAPLDARARITDPDATRKLKPTGDIYDRLDERLRGLEELERSLTIDGLRGILPQVTYPVDTQTTFSCVACGHALPYIPGTEGLCVCGKRYSIPKGG